VNFWPIVFTGYTPHPCKSNCKLAPYKAGEAGHFVTITGLSKVEYWDRGKDWRWVRIYNSFVNGPQYYKAFEFFGFQNGYAHGAMYVYRTNSSGP
jgi:hypothetical protein